jgi:(2Fe-2S) ferredoxin
MWYTVLMSPSVESIVMKLTLDGEEVPAFTRTSVLMLKLR